MTADSKEQRARDAALATAQYEAEGKAIREKTARLRELRLAHEAAAKGTGTTEKTSKGSATKKRSSKPKANAERLSDWLAAQQNQGRRS
jgi:hypothetical protein